MKTLLVVLLGLSTTLAGPLIYDGLISSNYKFAASVYKEVALQNEKNFLVSPLSAQVILSLTQSGAEDETAQELQKVLKFPLIKELIECSTGTLLQMLEEEHDYILKTANKIYVKENFAIRDDFTRIANEIYKAEIENIEFARNIEAARSINQWVEEKTNYKIHNLIDPDILNKRTRAIFLNALYFRGNWTTPFQFFSTNKQDFDTFDGVVKADTMHVYEEYFQFYEKPHLNATFLELPIVGGNASMTIVLPGDKGGLPLLEQNIYEVLASPPARYREMFNVALPKFKIESRIDFKSILKHLGVKKAFEDGKADFTRIAGAKGELFIDDVIQKTYVDVNEDGMEAAAATFVVKVVNRNAESPRMFTANRPFLFFLKIEELVVFVGRVMEPQY